MNEKQTAELLDGLRTAFLNRANRDGVLSRFWGMVGERTAGQEDAANYAARLGEVLSETLLEETVAVGDGRIRFAEALTGTDPEELLRTVDGTLGQMMRQAYRMVNDAGAQAQKIADEANGLGLRSVLGNYPDERLQGLYQKIAEAAAESSEFGIRNSELKSAELTGRLTAVGAPPAGGDRKSGGTVESWLGEPVVNNVQAFYDEHVRANAEARFRMGLGPVIVRTAAPGCCAWCARLSGVYDYDEVRDTGNDVFRRHERCRCTVTYRNGGTVQDVWSKKMYAPDEKTLAQRKAYGLEESRSRPPTPEEYIRQEEEKALAKATGRVIINAYRSDGLPVKNDGNISEQTIEIVNKASKKIMEDIPVLGKYIEGVFFGDTDDALGICHYSPDTGRCFIELSIFDFANPQILKEKLHLDYLKRVSYDTERIESLVAHEMGHGCHYALALKRAGLIPGVPLSTLQLAIFENERAKIREEIYCAAFGKESFDEINRLCIEQLGTKAQDPAELVAQSFGNFYFGKKKSKIAKRIVKYFERELK